jgi:hypothetical protein
LSSERSPAHSRRRPPLHSKRFRGDEDRINQPDDTLDNGANDHRAGGGGLAGDGAGGDGAGGAGVAAAGVAGDGAGGAGAAGAVAAGAGTAAAGTAAAGSAIGTGAIGTGAIDVGAGDGAAGDGAAGAPASPSRFPAPVIARPQRGRAAWWEITAVFIGSLGLALALFHRDLSDLYNAQIGGAGDADEYSWFLSWMPFALGHGLNPLVSTYVNYPTGINLMWNTSVLLPSFVMSPVTMVFGAAFSYNILITLAPVLSATISHVAFRRWTGPLPALAGALIFGFSPYMVAQSVGHLAQTLLLSAPVFLVLLDRLLVVQSSKPWREGVLLGLLAWAQLLTGEEILAIEAVVGAVTIAVLCCLARREISLRLPYALRGSAVAAGLFALLSSPFLAYQYLGPYKVQDAHPANVYVTDLLNFFIPTNITQLAPAAALRVSAHFTGNGAEQNAYIGIPLVLFIIVAVVLARRRRITWVALTLGVTAAVLSMGPTVHISGHVSHLDLPDYLLAKLPVFHNLLPDRFASMMTLGEGLLVALGLEELKRLKRPAMAGGWALVGAGMAAIFPIIHFPANASPLFSAFTGGLACPPVGPSGPSARRRPPVALVVPATNELDLRWQAESGFCFVMPSATGMTGTNKGDLKKRGLLLKLADPVHAMQAPTPALRAEAAQEIQELGIREIVVGPESPAVPNGSPEQQAEAVVWVEWLLGQAPQQGYDMYRSYFWKDLPPVSDIASGHVAIVPGAPTNGVVPPQTTLAPPTTASPQTTPPPRH